MDREILNLTPKKRFKIIDRTSFINVIVNFIIGFVKITIAIVSGSIAIASDAVINIGDTISGIITIVGNRFSLHKPTEKHPFGFGRIEYVTIIFAAIIMITVSGILAEVSVEHIITPVEVHINGFEYFLLVMIVVAKFGLFFYNKHKGEEANSGELEAVSNDSFIDAIGTLVVIILIIIDHFVKLELDGYISLGVALFIIGSNLIDIFKTLSLMLGTRPATFIIEEIRKTALSVKPVTDVRDIIIHSYGFNVHFGQMDISLPGDIDINETSKILKKLETLLNEKYNITFTFGISPANVVKPVSNTGTNRVKIVNKKA